jgi:hypothetical protein
LARASFEAAAGETVTARGVGSKIEPSLTVMLADSALLSFITPFFEDETLATPEVKLSAVATPKAVAVPALLTTVGGLALGLVRGAGEGEIVRPGVGGGGVAVGALRGGCEVVGGSGTPAAANSFSRFVRSVQVRICLHSAEND